MIPGQLHPAPLTSSQVVGWVSGSVMAAPWGRDVKMRPKSAVAYKGQVTVPTAPRPQSASGHGRVSTPRPGTPRVGTPRLGTPRVGTPRPGTPRVYTPRPGTPRVGTPRPGSYGRGKPST